MLALKVLRDFAMPATLLVIAGLMAHDRLAPAVDLRPEHEIDGVALGRAYAPVLSSTYADAWVAAAKSLEQGKSVSEAQRTLQARWTEARVKAFRSRVQPVLSLVLPEGAEPSSAAERSRVVALWRSFARGLQEAR
jgi:hypothetical protein